jgi:hypothetical protein
MLTYKDFSHVVKAAQKNSRSNANIVYFVCCKLNTQNFISQTVELSKNLCAI